MKVFLVLVVMLMVSACGVTDKQRLQVVQDTNDRIERMRRAEADADIALAKALEVAAAQKPELVAAVAGQVMLARALKTGQAQSGFVAPERPRDFLDYIDAGTRLLGAVGSVAVPLVGVLEQGRTARAGYTRDLGVETVRQQGETGRIQTVANIASDVVTNRPSPNVTTNTYTFGRDGVLGGNQANNNSTTTTTCTGGNGAAGGNGGVGGVTTPGAAGAAGGSGGDACR